MKCVLCGKEREIMFPGDKGHNPEPLKRFKDGTCCNDCEYQFVMPARGISYKTAMELKKIDLKLLEKWKNDKRTKKQNKKTVRVK